MGFWKYAEEDPEYIAVVDPDGTEHSAGDVLALANQWVHALRVLGMERNDTVAAVLAERLAAVRALPRGAASRLLLRADQLPAERVGDRIHHQRLRREGIRQRRTLRRPRRQGRRRSGRIPRTRGSSFGTIPGFRPVDDALAGQPTTLPDNRSTGASMHYTSGTTGKPKGVKRALNEIDPDTSAELFTFLLQLFGITPRDNNVHLSTSPNYHTAVTTFAGNSLHMGHTVVCMDKWDAEETLRLIERYRCTHTHMVPTQFIRMLQLPDDVRAKYDVSAMKYAIHAAAPCPVDTKRKMLEWWGPVIWEYYAATEGGGTIAPPDEWVKYPGTVGRAWPTAELKITDDDGNVMPTGEPGTVWMRMGTAALRIQGRRGEDEEVARRRGLLHCRRRRVPERGRLPVPLRPQERHDHRGRHQHLPGRDRELHPRSSRSRRRRGVRHSRTRISANRSRPSCNRCRASRPTMCCASRSWSTCAKSSASTSGRGASTSAKSCRVNPPASC